MMDGLHNPQSFVQHSSDEAKLTALVLGKTTFQAKGRL